MTTGTFVESGMTFGPFLAGHCFYIEKCACYRRIQHGVQMAEVLLLQKKTENSPVVWVIEAKSSSPRPGTPTKFAEFIEEIRSKLTNGFLLGVAAILDRHSDAPAELPAPFKTLDLKQTGFRFVLVINGHKREWLAPLQDALTQALKPVIKTWALPPLSVAVINHDMAQKLGLIDLNPGI